MTAAQESKDPTGAHRLRQDGSQGRALYAPIQKENKDGIQHDVQYRADQHAEHSHQRFSLGADEAVQPQGQLDEYRPQQIDADIVHRVANGGIRGAEGVQNRFFVHAEAHCHQQGGRQQEDQGIAQDPLGLVPSPGTQLDGGQGRAALSGKGGEGGHQSDDRKCNAHAGEGGAAHLRDVSNVDAVHDVIQHIDELGRHRGYGQLQHEPSDGRGGKLLFIFMGLRQKTHSLPEI